MALTKAQVREILSTAGADSERIGEAVDKIIDGHAASIEALREQVKQGEGNAARIEELEKQLAQAQKNDNGQLQVKYEALVEDHEALKKEYETYKADTEAKAVRAEKTEFYRGLLKEAGIVSEKRIESIVKVSQSAIDALEIKDGKVKGASDIKKSIAEEWDEFIPKDGVQGADTAKPPQNNGGSNFENMSLADKMVFANEHPDHAEVKAWLAK